MADFKATAEQYVIQLNDKLKDNAYAKMAEEKTGVKPALLVIGAGFVLVLLTLLVFGQAVVTELVTFLPPVFMTIMGISQKTVDAPFWMTYWLVFGLLQTLESLTDYLEEGIPLYYWLKMLFLVWCFHSKTKGATIIYDNLLSKLLGTAEEKPEEVGVPKPSGGQLDEKDDAPEENEDTQEAGEI
uniref:Receptor expression-enhancing protein n=1 Tax=Lotharella oceanica TaxID=641309 RepID=A0A7S2TLH9_9EUKA|mmetsp:Transcript_1969/g.3727  ORF Transcript_1969/g.3727 Transcript_1969/m.3727 type:complete len:185 (+) Transcript_1969:74-628(+)|eukprot:CAMPEP_0170166582 /NCGR_PEP_ID=MMETSP0040_2-20121228/231_1 /TAXON_ID=641309 /ORGANISM="Lotharella oceanica, Strain CCMP622" /LENGTH=184 /DNA_ID=CAMNT_0010404343 /DNA_START=62 /DNA_END=616 /DNA_ORIENTATION=+